MTRRTRGTAPSETNHLRELHRAVARYKGARDDRDEAIREAHLGGLSYRQIARETGLSHGRVQQLVNEGSDDE